MTFRTYAYFPWSRHMKYPTGNIAVGALLKFLSRRDRSLVGGGITHYDINKLLHCAEREKMRKKGSEEEK